MKLGWRRLVRAVAGTFVGCVVSLVVVSGQTAPAQQSPPMAETVFKNVQVLKGIPVDEFMDTMGMFAAATAKDCTGCHVGDILTRREAFAEPTAQIQMARGMVRMMNEINAKFFGGRKRVTCYTCHINSPAPNRVPNLSIQYGSPLPENPNSMDFVALKDVPANQVDQIFAKYLEALGGAPRLNAVTSFVATGTYAGWDTAFGEVPVEIFARAPDQLATIVHRREGNNMWTFDGRTAWFAGVDSAIPNFTTTYTGGNLQGAKIEALVALTPTRLQQSFGRWQVSEDLIDDKPVQVLQGINQGELPVNLYFDESGLLVRLVRWADTAVGPVPTQYDYSDYRDVGGVRRPFQWVKTWTNNKATFKLKDVRPNVAIEPARFARPSA